jgi:8-oxo-dGTP pyrophosphatase MutT (NUDIX family)
MDNGYCIYFGEKACYITSHMNEKLYALTSWGGTILVNQPNPGAILSSIHDLDRTEAEAAIILTNKVDYYWTLFKDQFQCLRAGGGLVRNSEGDFLFIHRRGRWDLPKGKQDEGETIEACALREVKEETGLYQVFVNAPLGNTWHAYHENGKFILKESVWYLMDAPSNQSTTPQSEEDINEIRWVAENELDEVLKDTYPSIRDVIRKYKKRV